MNYTYKNIRMDISNGDIVLFNYTSFLGKLINFFQQEEYNHVGMFWWFGDRLFIVHSNWIVHMMFASKLLTADNFKVVRYINPINERAIWRRLELAMNRRYDFFGLFRHMLYSISAYFPSLRKEQEEKAFVCSELLAWVLDLPAWYRYQPKDFNAKQFKERFNVRLGSNQTK